MRTLFAPLVATALLLAPAAVSAASAPHPLSTGSAGMSERVGWWEQRGRLEEARARYNRLPPPMRAYYDNLEYRIETLEGWRGGDMQQRNPRQFRAIGDLIDEMRSEQYAILNYRYRR